MIHSTASALAAIQDCESFFGWNALAGPTKLWWPRRAAQTAEQRAASLAADAARHAAAR